ncbi:nuclear transport factor 2 family protein [Parasphingopyxis algicola]|uniref:nuclear transport factor 2 family protein n=1 Tax=Parasphingopyxis algicola TaxID=2026624 RepID=UPI00159FAFFB|nr:nuclear transport factor 2 family protein [Parasphingopyxis algicola]QLC24863.1 nuclear transport factor 2 family protein [Parasphingopyxis algicola]
MRNRKEQIIRDAYDAFNSRDADTLIGYVTEDVNWPDGTTSDPDKRLHGRDALREYWQKQWDVTVTRDTPTEVTELPDGRVMVRLDQVVRDLKGEEVSKGSFEYFFEMRGDLISRLDITYL